MDDQTQNPVPGQQPPAPMSGSDQSGSMPMPEPTVPPMPEPTNPTLPPSMPPSTPPTGGMGEPTQGGGQPQSGM